MKEKRRSYPPTRNDSGDAFIADVTRERSRLPEDAEEFAEEFIATATSAEDAHTDARQELVVEELGGPYLEIDGQDKANADWFSLDDDEPETVREVVDEEETR